MRSYSLIPPLSLNSSSNDFSIELKRTHSVKRKNSLKPIKEEDEKQNLSTYKTSMNTQSPFQTTNEDKSHYKNRTYHISKKSSLISEKKLLLNKVIVQVKLHQMIIFQILYFLILIVII